MPLISLKSNRLYAEQEERVLYRTFHRDNDRYLEREDEPEKFKILCDVDDASPTCIKEAKHIIELMEDLEIVLAEACQNKDTEIANHLKEIFVLCKISLWNEGKFCLEFHPWGVLLESYPKDIPEKYRYNISALD